MVIQGNIKVHLGLAMRIYKQGRLSELRTLKHIKLTSLKSIGSYPIYRGKNLCEEYCQKNRNDG